MVDFGQSNTYTGKNEPPQPRQSSVKGPSYQEEALGDQRARDREAIYSRNYENSMKATDLGIDKSDIVKLAAQEHLMTLFEDYNKTQAELLPKSKSGLISPEDKDVLKQKEIAVLAEYRNVLASKENYETVMAQARQLDRTGEVDWDVMQPEEEAYVKYGKPYTRTRVALKPIDVNIAVTDTIKKLTSSSDPIKDVTLTNPDGTTRKGTARIDPNDEKKIADVIRISVSDDQVLDDVTRKWNKWFETASLEDKKKYLVETDDKPGYTTKLEKDNAILKWLQDDPQVRASAIGFEDYPPSKPKTTPEKMIKATETNNANSTYDTKSNYSAHGKVWGTHVDIGSKVTTPKLVTINEYTDLSGGGGVKRLGTATEVKVLSYIPDKDLLIVRVENSARSKAADGTQIGSVRENDILALPAKDYNEMLQNKPYFIDRTSLMKQYGASQTRTPAPLKTSGITWK